MDRIAALFRIFLETLSGSLSQIIAVLLLSFSIACSSSSCCFILSSSFLSFSLILCFPFQLTTVYTDSLRMAVFLCRHRFYKVVVALRVVLSDERKMQEPEKELILILVTLYLNSLARAFLFMCKKRNCDSFFPGNEMIYGRLV